MRKIFRLLMWIILIGGISVGGYFCYNFAQEKIQHILYDNLIQKIDKEAFTKIEKLEIDTKEINEQKIRSYYPLDESGNRQKELEKKINSIIEKTKLGDKEVVTYSYEKNKLEDLNIYIYILRKDVYIKELFSYVRKSSDVVSTDYEDSSGITSIENMLDVPSVDSKIVVDNLKKFLKDNSSNIEGTDSIIASLDKGGLEELAYVYTEEELSILGENLEKIDIPVNIVIPYFKKDVVHNKYQDVYQQNIESVEAERSTLREKYLKELVVNISKKVPTKKIALTFDDGPNPATTNKILDILKQHQVKSTFFVLGSLVSGNENILKRQVTEGHEIANHTWSHVNLATSSKEVIKKEMDNTQAAIKEAVGVTPKVMRPPYGSINYNSAKHIDLPIILWDVDSKDWALKNPVAISKRVVSTTKNGSIILLHDIHQTTVESVENIVVSLKKAGFEFVTVSELYKPNELASGVSYVSENSARLVE